MANNQPDLYQQYGQQYVQPQDAPAAQGGQSIADRISGVVKKISERIFTPIEEEEDGDTNLEGTEEDRRDKLAEINRKIDLTFTEVDEKRFGRYLTLRDVYENNLAKYSNVFGLTDVNKLGHVRASYNYLSQVVDKLTNFLTAKAPIINVPPRQTDDPVEVERATNIKYFLDKIHHQNRFKYFFKRAGHMQSLFGDAFIKGPWWDPKTKRICYTWVEDPGQVFMGWKDNRFEEVDWVAFQTLQSVDSIKAQYGLDNVAPYEGRIIGGTYPVPSPTKRWTERQDRQTMQLDALVTEYWDEEVMMLVINNSDIVQYIEHDYGFIPVQKVENVHVDNRPWGKADVEELMDANVELQDRMNDAADAIRQGAVPRFKVVNDTNFDVDSVKAGANGQFIFVNGDKADVGPIPSSVSIAPYEMYIKSIMQIIYDLGLPAIAWGGHAPETSGHSYNFQYQAITDKVRNKQLIWEMALETLNERILILAEKYIPGIKTILDGHFVTDIEWEDFMPLMTSDNIVNVSNKRDRGLISYHTALKELGYKDPDAELDLIIQEWSDPKLAPVIAKNALLTEGIQKTIQEVFGRPGAIPIPPRTTVSLNGDLTPEQESVHASHIGMGQSEGAQGRYAIDVPGGVQSLDNAKYPTFAEMSMDQGGQGGQQGSNPTLQPSQNSTPQPMSAPGVPMATSSSPAGAVAQANQNDQASGQ